MLNDARSGRFAPAPEHLAAPERQLWDKLIRSYTLDDPAAQELLLQACEARGRAREAREQLEREGATYKDDRNNLNGGRDRALGAGLVLIRNAPVAARSRRRLEVTTPILPRRQQRSKRLHSGALRWLLGARSEWIYERGGCTHGSIVRYKFLFAHACTTEAWAEHCHELWQIYGPAVRAWHLRHWPDKRPPRTPFEAERSFRRRVRERSRGRQ
jgi:hypothetical protein